MKLATMLVRLLARLLCGETVGVSIGTTQGGAIESAIISPASLPQTPETAGDESHRAGLRRRAGYRWCHEGAPGGPGAPVVDRWTLTGERN